MVGESARADEMITLPALTKGPSGDEEGRRV